MEQAIRISVAGVELDGDLVLPQEPIGLVLFAHGSGSSRFSPRNRFVAETFQSRQMATVLVDLLTAGEEDIDARTAQFRFDIDLLAGRVVNAIDWLSVKPETAHLPVGLFGASTGAAAAIVAAVRRAHHVAAVVSRGGRPDLAGPALTQLKAPTLLIVGGNDPEVLRLNREAMAKMQLVRRSDVRGGGSNAALEIVSGATHLFEEPGALREVARLAGGWFGRWLTAGVIPAVRGK